MADLGASDPSGAIRLDWQEYDPGVNHVLGGNRRHGFETERRPA